MTKQDRVREIEELIQKNEAEVELCKGNDGKMERYYQGKVDAFTTALRIVE